MRRVWHWFWDEPHKAINRTLLLGAAALMVVMVSALAVDDAMTAVFVTLCALTWAVSLDYARAPWWKSEIGRGFMFRNTALAVLLSWIVAGLAGWVQFDGRGRVTAALAAILALTFLNFYLTLARKQYDEPYEDSEEAP